MKTTQILNSLSEKIGLELSKIMVETECSPEEMIYSLNITYVSLFATCCRYRFEFFSEQVEHVEKRIINHLQKCFDSAKQQMSEPPTETPQTES